METLISKRPWGQFVQYCQNENATVKIISVNPGQALSVQFHKHRDELWVALDSGLIATIDGKDEYMSEGRELFIPRGAVHSVHSRSAETARFLEVSFGHFDEEDITRVSDKYGRV